MWRTVTTMKANDIIAGLSFIVLILLGLKDVLLELRQIRRELKRKDGERHE